MAGTTPYLRLSYFDFGDQLDTPINAQREIDRFVLIDKQIYGLYQIFGDGVIVGWEIFDNGYSDRTGISIGILPGSGIINGIANETQFPAYVDGLPPSSSTDIYVTLSGGAVKNRLPTFVKTSSNLGAGVWALKLATVVTSSNGISSIDNTVREFISFQQDIIDEVNNHKHRGLPTKIDLGREVKNQLSGANIADLDASKINNGRLEATRVPVLDHNDLENIGILTHASLDSFVQSITTPNLGLLGEVSIINLLRQTVFLKYRYPLVDEFLVNELAILPGISSNDQIDFTASTAVIDTIASCIAGFPFANTDAYFFTSNFVLPENITRGILTSRKTTPNNSQVTFGISTENSIDFDDYEVVSEDRVFVLGQPGTNLRIGIKLTSGAGHHDPYAISFNNYVDFVFVNESPSAHDFHFRVRFYNDEFYTDLAVTKYSGTDQEGWVINDTEQIPEDGYRVSSSESITVTFYPDASNFTPGKMYYLIIDAFDGSGFTSESSGYTFVSAGGTTCDQYAGLPTVKNFAILFEMENGGKIMLNL